MANIVVGAFTTESEAAEAVHELELKGYKAENITVLMNRRASDRLEDHTNVHIEDALYNPGSSESFWKKIKRGFAQDVGPEDNLSSFEMLVSYGLSEEQAKEYANVLETGNIVLIADENKKASHRRVAPIADDNLDSLDRTGRTNLADDDVESNSGHQYIVAEDEEPSVEEDTDQKENKERRKKQSEGSKERTEEEKVLDENPVLNKATQEREDRSL